MDFDLNSMLKIKSNRHAQIKPLHMVSVAAGTTKRRESQQKARKSTRLDVLDTIRNITQTPTQTEQDLNIQKGGKSLIESKLTKKQPEKAQEDQNIAKHEHRRKQLERWKEDKVKQKKEQAAHKKRPFLAGASTYVAPATVNTARLAISSVTDTARVTRSQARAASSNNNHQQNLHTTTTRSFAPHDAKFQPPEFRTASQYKLQSVSKTKVTFNVTFEPIIPRKQATSKNMSQKIVTESKFYSSKTKTTASRQNNVNRVTEASTSTGQPIAKRTLRNTNILDSQPSCSGYKAKNTKSAEYGCSGKRNLRSTKAIDTQASCSGYRPRSSEAFTEKNWLISKTEAPLTKNLPSTSSAPPLANRCLRNSKKTLTMISSSSSDESPVTKRSLRSAKPVTVKPTNKQTLSKIKKRVQTPRHKLPKKNTETRKSMLKEITPQAIAWSNSTESSSESSGGIDKVDKRRRSARNTQISVSTDSMESSPIIPETSCDVHNTKSLDTRVDTPYKHTTLVISPSENPANNSPVIKQCLLHLQTPKQNFFPKSESSSEEKLRSPKSPVDATVTPTKCDTRLSTNFCPSPELAEEMKISPTVTLSRGKAAARDEMKWKLSEGLFEEETCRVEHFRKQLAGEIERMTAMCEQWDNISSRETLPEFVQENILSAVGQARLLMSKKLQQYAGLIEDCARQLLGEQPESGKHPVTPTDLKGFWDMVFMQVENVDIKFKNLEKLRERNWLEEKPIKTKMATTKKPLPLSKPAETVKPAAVSSIREMIAARRRAQREQQTLAPPVEILAPASPAGGTRVFHGGFFSVTSPVRSPVPRAPTLLRTVLSSEAEKARTASAAKAKINRSASFAMLRASLIGRGVDCDDNDDWPLTPASTINLAATPGRSILKSSTKTPHDRQHSCKSAKVLFVDQCRSPHCDEPSRTENRDASKTLTFDDDEHKAEDININVENEILEYVDSENCNQNTLTENSGVLNVMKTIEKEMSQTETKEYASKTLRENPIVLVTPKRTPITRKSTEKDSEDQIAEKEKKPKDQIAEKEKKPKDQIAEKEKKPKDQIAEKEKKPKDQIAEKEKKPKDQIAEKEKKPKDQIDEKENEPEDKEEAQPVKTRRRSSRKSLFEIEVIDEPRSARKAKSKAQAALQSIKTRNRKSMI